MVHIKAFQTGLLNFDKKFAAVPGYVYGHYNRMQTLDTAASFLPYTAIDKASYGPGAPFTDLKRPYHEGFQRDAGQDDGTAYAEKQATKREELRRYINDHTIPVQVGSHDLTQKPIAIIYNPASGRGRDIRALIQTTLLEKGGIQCVFYETERYMHAWKLAGGLIDFSEHSALMAVGGDGTFHEVINGML